MARLVFSFIKILLIKLDLARIVGDIKKSLPKDKIGVY
jgi:hypothetical protein